MKYCSNCASQVTITIPQGDNRPRYVCGNCDTIHYQNPRIIAGCLPFYGDKVLLCKRAIEPRKGFWTLPAGFMENGESTQEAALRETVEESNADVTILQLYTVTSIIHVEQVQMLYLAEMRTPNYAPSSESSEVELFSEEQIPWQELAFPTIENALKLFFNDRKEQNFPLREITINRNR